MKAGDKVVCVDDNFDRPYNQVQKQHGYTPSAWPVRGQVYVIREIETDVESGFLCIRLVGIVGQIHPWFNKEGAFLASRFRLVSEVGHPPIAVEQPIAPEPVRK